MCQFNVGSPLNQHWPNVDSLLGFTHSTLTQCCHIALMRFIGCTAGIMLTIPLILHCDLTTLLGVEGRKPV